ncbi:unnamed protein product [Chondrus crispus]|uniref:Uncharacterized protein n=1 Tax=Chondrus crispus TaxID=2769 RepID=R7QMC9_CHOCR|nr:unnamed protein product [Chondrus crispus]CDF38923.1 unnamed protein product [Chondrus crispus]|eukprot:XP_005718828.1 unnamed protein product [Chondrus crispus]
MTSTGAGSTGEKCDVHGVWTEEITVKPVGLQPGRRYLRCSLPLPQRCQFFRLLETIQNRAPRQDFRRSSVEMPGRSAPFFQHEKDARSRNGPSSRLNQATSLGSRQTSIGGFRIGSSRGVDDRRSRPSSAGNTSIMGEEAAAEKCRCGNDAVKRTVRKEGPNKGKNFWVCRKPHGEQCGWFEWAVAPASPHRDTRKRPHSRYREDSFGQQGGSNETSTDISRAERIHEPAEKRARHAPQHSVSITLEDIDHVSFTITTNGPAELKEALQNYEHAKVKKTNFLGVEKVTIPIENTFSCEAYVEASVRTQFEYGTPREIICRIIEYRAAENKREEQGGIFTQSLEGVLPEIMCEKLMEFQWEGIHFALKRGGRCLFGDDMGLGKTLQAIAVARVYMNDWPLLIVCPSSLRLNWKEELLKWLDHDLDEEDILVIMTGRDIDRPLERVNIVSYDLLRKIPPAFLRRCQFIIADESHYLKSMTAKRSQALTPLIKGAKRALLLSGTPALSRPVELFPQINAISPLLFPLYQEYVERYCAAHVGRFGYDVSGASNLDELHTMLRGSLLIRRKKEEVLSQLPDKQRQVLWVQTKAKAMKEVESAMVKMEKLKDEARNPSSEGRARALNFDIKAAQNELYKLTAFAKIESVKEFCKDTAETGCKFIVFLHHKEVMTQLNEFVTSKLKLGRICIDGSTPQGNRQNLCRQFQEDPKCRVALLSITAAGVGLTLTKATVVLFAELYWNPGSLLQAEDRAHRIGQKDCVLVKYLLARKTIDESMWSTIRRKLTVVGHSLTGTAARMELTEDKDAGDPKQKDISSFFKAKTKSASLKICSTTQLTEVVEIDDEEDETPQATAQNGDKDNSLPDEDNMFPASLRDMQKPPLHAEVLHVPDDFGDMDLKAARARQAQLDADIAFARKLQAQFDAEEAL